jgi:hypothetical protein
MRSLTGLTLSLALLTSVGSAQQKVEAEASPAQQAATQNPDRSAIDALLKRYATAYNHQSLDELVAVWPSLQNDKKAFKKTKDEFGRVDVSEMNVSLQVREVQPAASGDTLVHCTRSDEYKKTQTTAYTSGDNMMGSMPAQNPGPAHLNEKKPVHKTSDVWLALHKSGDAWTIASVSDKKPH